MESSWKRDCSWHLNETENPRESRLSWWSWKGLALWKLWNTSLRMALHTHWAFDGLKTQLGPLAFRIPRNHTLTYIFTNFSIFRIFFLFFKRICWLFDWLLYLFWARRFKIDIRLHTSCLRERLRDLAVFNSCEMTTFVIIFWDKILYEKIMKFPDFKDKT